MDPQEWPETLASVVIQHFIQLWSNRVHTEALAMKMGGGEPIHPPERPREAAELHLPIQYCLVRGLRLHVHNLRVVSAVS